MIYEPRQHGCLCDACPLNEKRPVPPEIRPGAKLLVVGQASGPVETARGYPLAGPSGLLFEKALAACGHSREEVSVSNALLCMPPETMSKKDWAQALACCEPRLQREVQEHPAVLAFGAVAFKALQKLKGEVVDLRESSDPDEDGNAFGEAGLMRLRGFPLDLAGRPFLATWNPAHVLRTRRWVDTFLWDVGKAFRHAAGALDWVDPEMHFDPSTDECDSVFAQLEASNKRPIIDVETTYEKAYVAKLRCVGVGTSELTIVLPWRSVETPARKFRMTPAQCRERYNNFFGRVKRAAGQNILSFDRTILDRYGLVLPADTLDTLAADHCRDPELPHDLDYLASRFTDAPKHKPGGGDHWTSDAELQTYCLYPHTPIVLADGSTREIQKIVQNKESVDVLSLSRTGQIEPARVVGWHRQQIAGQKWWRIKTADDRMHAQGLRCTPEHQVMTTRGWVEAQYVRVGDQLATPEHALGDLERCALLGTCLGDSSLVIAPRERGHRATAKTAGVQGSHATSSGLADAKCAVLPRLVIGTDFFTKPSFIKGRLAAGSHSRRYGSHLYHVFAQFLPLIYEGRTRRLHTSVLDQLGPVGLAWWFMDDGCLQKGRPGVRDNVTIAVQRYPRVDVDDAKAWFCSHFGSTWVGKDNVLRLSTDAAEAFCRHVAPHIFPTQRYKLVRHIKLPDYQPIMFPPASEPHWSPVEFSGSYVPDVSAGASARIKAKTRYCLTVAGNHNFFTTFGLVHNCMRDLATTFAVAPKAFAGLNRKVYDADTRFMEIARQMHLIGFHLDVTERERHRVRLTQAMQEARFKAQAILGKDVNLSSHEAVRHYLFTERGLPWPSLVTASELPSTSKDAIYELLTRALPDDVGRWIEQGLLEFRWAQKKLTAFVETSVPDELGRVHADWNAVAQIVGRPSAKKPALNTMPHLKDDTDSVRSMFDAEPGHVLVSADMSQLHLRLVTVFANIGIWKEVFSNPKLDLHKINAAIFFGKPESEIVDYERQFAKTLIYMFLYKGMPETACANMRKVKDPRTGTRPYAGFTLTQAEKLRERLLKRVPELQVWWDRELRTAKRQRMLKSYLLGRPHYFRDIDLSDIQPEEQSAVINYPVLSTEADLMGGGGAAGKFVEAFPWYLYGPNTGLIHHGYDSLTVETPADKVGQTAKMLREALETTIDGVHFSSECKTGLNWAKLDKLKGE